VTFLGGGSSEKRPYDVSHGRNRYARLVWLEGFLCGILKGIHNAIVDEHILISFPFAKPLTDWNVPHFTGIYALYECLMTSYQTGELFVSSQNT
jgi:hypothetical protein